MNYPTTTFTKALEALLFRSGLEGAAPPSSQYANMQVLLDLALRRCWEYTEWEFLRVLDGAVLDGMVVEGAGTAAANEIFLRDGLSGGRAAYTVVDNAADGGGLLAFNGEMLTFNGVPLAFNSAGDQILWNGAWQLLSGLYTSPEDVPTPDEVKVWLVGTGAAPAPTVRRLDWTDVGYDITDGRLVVEVYAQDPRRVASPRVVRTRIVSGGRLEVEPGAPLALWFAYVPGVPDWLVAEAVPLVPKVFVQPAVNLAYRMFLQGANSGDMEKARSVGEDAIPELDDLCLRFARMQTESRVQVRRNVPAGGRWGGRR